MLRIGERRIVLSASDLTAAATCEWALMRKLDARLGREVSLPEADDPMLARTAGLGDQHELRVLATLEERLGPAVVIDRPAFGGDPGDLGGWAAAIERATDETAAALEARAPLVFQGAFFDGGFQGFSDFLVLGERDGEPRYEVWDSKLARHAKITAVLQLAAYVDQLRRIDVPVDTVARLVLGDRSTSDHGVADVVPVYLDRRRHLEALVAGRLADVAATPWNDPRYVACGRCAACAEQVELHDDVLLVAGLSLRQRRRLRDAGIETLDDLAGAEPASTPLPATTFGKLRDQARLQVAHRAAPEGPIPYRVIDRRPIDLLPAPDPGDLFFDFEGDPLYEEKALWGIDYLFGAYGEAVDPGGSDPAFAALWAEDVAGERRAFLRFMQLVAERRSAHPGMHVYHYASYEKTHLLSIAARHQLLEDEVDDLLRDGVLIDLFTVVKRSLRVGTDSYSIKALEPLYMGTETRTGTKSAADSVEEFARYVDARDDGRAADAAAIRRDIVQYNRHDCRSTAMLRDWLLAERGNAPVPAADEPEDRVPAAPDPLTVDLFGLVDGVPVEDRTPAQTAVALAAAAVDYHRRENKRFWQEHYARLEDDAGDWAEQRGVVTIGDGQVTVVQDWHRPTPASGLARVLEIRGTIAPGSRIEMGKKGCYLLYDDPIPSVDASPTRTRDTQRLGHDRTEVRALSGGTLTVLEKLGKNGLEHGFLPMALTPTAPVGTGSIAAAIREWGGRLLQHLQAAPSLDEGAATFRDAAFDVLLRRRPLPEDLVAPIGPAADAITSSLLRLDRGTIAVQGPPGTGKTYTGSHVIRRLVERGWKVGVVAQSHATVEGMLDAVVKAGTPAAVVGKRLKDEKDRRPRPWTVLDERTLPGFVAASGGFVVGGTMWTFTNRNAVPFDALDLLVIDEAGQYSLANTIAVSLAARRLLLLGDPQQLPQVTQGAHPEPVDTSALGWLADGRDVLPDRFGYFLADTWRMVAEVCEPVSRLSYAGRLHPAAGAQQRLLAGVEPGLHAVPVAHAGNDTSSPEEAAVVVDLVRSFIDRDWSEHPAGEPAEPAPLGQQGVIVVAAYNAQVDLISERLRQAGLDGVEVGTVDRFQGREAAVSILSLAASSADEVPRGLEFLLMPNRLNVAISRAKWAAYLVHSPALARHLPTNLAALSMLGKFLRLVEGSPSARH